MKRLLTLVSLVFAVTSAQAAEIEDLVAELEANRWGWTTVDNGCVEAYRVFSFDRNITEMQSYIAEDDVTVVYQILSHGPNSITMQINGEDRLTSDGVPVIWQLRFGGQDSICWHRTDWGLLSCTPPLLRCETAPLQS